MSLARFPFLAVAFLVAVPAAAQSGAAACPPATTYDGFHQERVGSCFAREGSKVLFGHGVGFTVGVFRRAPNEYWQRTHLLGGQTSSPASNGGAADWRGGLLVLGDPGNSSLGGAHGSATLRRSLPDDTIPWLADLFPPDLGDPGGFGRSVAASPKGDLAAVGAPLAGGVGAVHLYRETAGGWLLETTLWGEASAPDGRFGEALTFVEDRLAVAVPGSFSTPDLRPHVVLFERLEGTWRGTTRLRPGGSATDVVAFGTALDADGSALVVGGRANVSGALAGRAFVYDTTIADWQERPVVLEPPATVADAGFGQALDLDGDRLAVGGSSAAYELRREPGGWQHLARFQPPAYGYSQYFGRAVSLYERGVLVGDFGWDPNGLDYPDGTGAVHAFDTTDHGQRLVACGHGQALQGSPPLQLRVDWPERAGMPYRVFGSATGTGPFSIGGAAVPLTPDVYSTLLQSFPAGAPFFPGMVGVLDGAGRASLSFQLPLGLPLALAGIDLHHAVLTFPAGAVDASNAVTFELRSL